MQISMKLVYQYIAIFINFSLTSNHLHPLQVGNCDSNSRLVVDEDDIGKFRPERGNPHNTEFFFFKIMETKDFFPFESIINVLVSSF